MKTRIVKYNKAGVNLYTVLVWLVRNARWEIVADVPVLADAIHVAMGYRIQADDAELILEDK